MQTVILCGGNGKRLWPYSNVRKKAMISISTKPLVSFLVQSIEEISKDSIYLLTDDYGSSFERYFRGDDQIKLIQIPSVMGSALAMQTVLDKIKDYTVILNGDTYIEKEDLQKLYSDVGNACLCHREYDSDIVSANVTCVLTDNNVSEFRIAARGNHFQFISCGYRLNNECISQLKYASTFFENLNVGVMPERELYIEDALNYYIVDGGTIRAYQTTSEFFDVNKPWDILRLNHYINEKRTTSIKENVINKHATIDSSAEINGHVVLGEGTHIGKNVVIDGNVIIGDNTTISKGAVIHGGTVIGSNVLIENYALVNSGTKGNTSIGDRCIIGHCSEISNSVIMERTSFAHFGSFCGIAGENVDIGGGTVSAYLRFDDRKEMHVVNGKKEIPAEYSNDVYIGDYCRTGTGSIILPGVIIGTYCLIGPGVVLNQDLKDRQGVLLEQNLKYVDSGPNKYGL